MIADRDYRQVLNYIYKLSDILTKKIKSDRMTIYLCMKPQQIIAAVLFSGAVSIVRGVNVCRS